MAAPSSSPTTSQQKDQQQQCTDQKQENQEKIATDPKEEAPSTTIDDERTSTPVAAEHTAASKDHETETTLTTTTDQLPTYADTEMSKHCVEAKKCLVNGELESALDFLEDGIEITKTTLSTMLLSQKNSATNDDDIQKKVDDVVALHESMAPLHYLYGTTLLYLIEENQDIVTNAVSTNVPDDNKDNDGDKPDEDNDNKNDVDEKVHLAVAALASSKAASLDVVPDETAKHSVARLSDDREDNDDYNANDDPQGTFGADAVEDDAQIAWENLETARTIITRMIASRPDDHKAGPPADKLRLDLSQVHLRLGDLQRLNGRYARAVDDYRRSLEYRQHNSFLPANHRSIADVHYNLGLTYMLLLAEASKQTTTGTTDNEEDDDKKPAATGKSCSGTDDLDEHQEDQDASAEEGPVDVNQLNDLRHQGFYHYVACTKALFGQICGLAGLVAADLIKQAEDTVGLLVANSDSGKAVCRTSSWYRDQQSIAIGQVKFLVDQMEHFPKPTNEEDKAEVDNLQQLLQEIKETLEEAENAEKGVHEVAEMRSEITKAVAAAAQVGADDDDDGKPKAAFGSTEAAAKTATANPVMVVKKKNKRPVDSDPGNDDPKKLKTG